MTNELTYLELLNAAMAGNGGVVPLLPPPPVSVEFRGGMLRIGFTVRGFDLEQPEDQELRFFLIEGGVDEEDAIRIAHVDFPAFSWRRRSFRGATTVTLFRSPDRGQGLLGVPEGIMTRVAE